ncbi:DNA polymerase [Bacillus mycoides]|uniref:DNA polymerase I-like protein-3'-5' exonuclease and polymerase domains n=1 Tax=Bacillus mycoides (strain KBAB4) TaxID=315730 RepID=A9VVI7_BACMK|nr:DNA polymerase [Bacillus mycoides]ABY46802.1 DNA polymerase I-like protein- 3'-5' exonuclease and polymerase domains [Bacillus mycoides KBAB4]
MELKLEMNLSMRSNATKGQEQRKRVAEVKQKVKDASETIEEAFDRISQMKLNDKESMQLKVAREAVKNGEAGRTGSGKMTKGEALGIGAKVMAKRESSLKSDRIRDVIENQPKNFHVIMKDEQLHPFMQRLREEVKLQQAQWKDRFEMLGVKSLTANDFEGTGIDAFLDLSIGFSIWLPILDEGYYLAYGHVEIEDESIPEEYAHKSDAPQLTRSRVLDMITPYLSNKDHGKSFHMGSARYDLHIAENDGYTIDGCVWDSLDAMYIMTEHLNSYGLKPLIQRYGQRYLGIENEVYTFDDLFGKRSPAPFNTLIVGIYAIYDVYYGWKLTEWQFETMKKTDKLLDCYALIDSKLSQVDAYMVRSGFNVDLDEFAQLEKEFTVKVDEAIDAVFSTYNIDDDFLRKMSLTLNGKKIQDWKSKQKTRIEKKRTQMLRARDIVKECKDNGKTTTKKYLNAKDNVKKYKQELDEFIRILNEEDVDLFIKTFEFSNRNHIAYLIYDHLGIKDRTHRIDKGKKRGTSTKVLEMYYEDEEALAPLAVVAEFQKLLGSFVSKIPKAMEADGRFHSKFDSGGTTTGRYSSSAYNGRPIDILDEFK